MTKPGERLAVVLFNLGGPDAPAAIKPFLFNLFNDPAIIGLPQPLRWLMAKVISGRRAEVAAAIYAHLGGRSPLLAETRAQAEALQAVLTAGGATVRVFVCMRYWHPMSDAVVRDVAAFAPDRIVLLPLYPQYSTTTSASSLDDWRRAAAAAGLRQPTHAVCCYPLQPGFITAVAGLVRQGLDQAAGAAPLRVLFSAHGLPQRVVDRGDPYPQQVEATVAAVVAALGRADLDHVVCYQSRVGPLKWIGPATEDELARAAADGVGVVMVPVAFVSEHSETLVELDIEYGQRAQELGVTKYVRVPTVGVSPAFIEGLATVVSEAVTRRRLIGPAGDRRVCPAGCGGCPAADLPPGAPLESTGR